MASINLFLVQYLLGVIDVQVGQPGKESHTKPIIFFVCLCNNLLLISPSQLHVSIWVTTCLLVKTEMCKGK